MIVSDTNGERLLPSEPQISVASLKRDLELMRFAGFWPPKVECGPMVYETLVNWTIFGQNFPAYGEAAEERRLAMEERMRRELIMGLTDMEFNGMPVRLFDDVPDGRFWPSREPGNSNSRPFQGTEAHDAFRTTEA